MAAITDLSDLINRSTGGASGTPENVFVYKVGRIAGVAAPATMLGKPHSLWLYDGFPGAGVAPGAVAVPTNATAGAAPFTNPSGGRQKWMTQIHMTPSVACGIVLYDRLLHIGGLNATTITAQTVGGTITRHTGGEGNFAFVEIYSTIGATATTLTMSYTNQAGVAGRTSPAITFGGTANREQTRALMIPLQAGDTGIQSIQSVTAGTTALAGNFGVTLGHPVANLQAGTSGQMAWRDFTTGLPGIPEVQADACLAWLQFPLSTTVTEFGGGYAMIEA